MKTSLLALAIFLSGTLCTHAELYMPVGTNTGVTAHFNFTVDSLLNQVVLQVDNRHAGVGGVTGTITSFGFAVPTDLAASGTLISQSWDILMPGRTEPAPWTVTQPYVINAGGNGYGQTFGLLTGANANGGAPQAGIKFGEVVTFVYQFADFGPSEAIPGLNGVTARWQEVSVEPGSDQGMVGPGLTPVPESSTYGLVGAGGLLLLTLFRRRRGHRA
jgi:hypothetical protein